jgi:hypothetical protein
MKTIDEIAKIRQEKLEKKYLDENGINKALYCRDNIEDIIEECADILNIADIYQKRIAPFFDKSKGVKCTCILVTLLKKEVRRIANELISKLEMPDYPSELRKEDVVRIGIDDKRE